MDGHNLRTGYDNVARSAEAVGDVAQSFRASLIDTVLARWCMGASTVPRMRLVIAEDSLVVREGLVALLSTVPDVEVVGVARTATELIGTVEATLPDVVLTDIRMPPTNTDEGIRVAQLLRERHPTTGVVVLSQHLDAAYALDLLGSGSDRRGYLLKERLGDAEQLLTALRTVVSGGSYVDPTVVDALVAARTRTASPLSFLAPRELEILSELATGRSNASIAGRLSLSERSVEKYINTLFAKLGLSDDSESNRRVKAVLLFLSRPG